MLNTSALVPETVSCAVCRATDMCGMAANACHSCPNRLRKDSRWSQRLEDHGRAYTDQTGSDHDIVVVRKLSVTPE